MSAEAGIWILGEVDRPAWSRRPAFAGMTTQASGIKPNPVCKNRCVRAKLEGLLLLHTGRAYFTYHVLFASLLLTVPLLRNGTTFQPAIIVTKKDNIGKIYR